MNMIVCIDCEQIYDDCAPWQIGCTDSRCSSCEEDRLEQSEICLLLNVDEEYRERIDSVISMEIHLQPQNGVSYDVVIAQIGGEESFPSIMKRANSLASKRIFFEPGLIIDPVICERSNSVLLNDNDLVALIRSANSQEVEL